MSGHLYIHIGPPKTATTSLQLGLQRCLDPSFAYLGTRQPRALENLDESRVILAFASGRESGDLVEIIKRIKDLISAGKTVFLSEEMFLVWQPQSSFWDKLKRLEEALLDIPHSYIMTLRDPIDALPSYYQEVYAGLSMPEKWNAQRFFKHERCDSFDYMKVTRFIESLNQDIRLIDFKLLTRSEISFKELLGSEVNLSGTISILKENVGGKNKDNKRSMPPITLTDVFRYRSFQRIKNFSKSHLPDFFRYVKVFSEKFRIRGHRHEFITVHEPRLSELRQSYFEALEYAKPHTNA